MVETRKRILSKAKLALGPMTILESPTRRQGPWINVPLRGTPLTPLRLAQLEVCIEPHNKTLDNADDVLHVTLALLLEFVCKLLVNGSDRGRTGDILARAEEAKMKFRLRNGGPMLCRS